MARARALVYCNGQAGADSVVLQPHDRIELGASTLVFVPLVGPQFHAGTPGRERRRRAAHRPRAGPAPGAARIAAGRLAASWPLADAATAAHGGHLAVLADGMGGGRNGLWAAEQAVQAFIHTYQAKTADEAVPAALQRAMHAANAVVHDEAQRLSAVDRMGTTLAAAVVLRARSCTG
jgi:hypothetical protein